MRFSRSIFIGVAVMVPFAVSAQDMPEVVPTCWSPQAMSPPTVLAGTTSNLPGLSWNGSEFGMFSAEAGRLRFRRAYPDGTVSASTVVPVPTTLSHTVSGEPSVVWNGSVWGVAFAVTESGIPVQTWFARVNRDGVVVAPAQRVSNVGVTPTWASDQPSVAWTPAGQSWGVVFRDFRNGASNTDIAGTFLDSAGAVLNGGLTHDVLLAGAAGNQLNPEAGTSPALGGYFAVVWEDNRVVPTNLYGNTYYYYDATPIGESQITASPSGATSPSLAAAGNAYGLAWTDSRDGNYEIYFRRLFYTVAPVGLEIRLTNDSFASQAPALGWNGSEHGLAFTDSRSGFPEVWFTRLTASGGGASAVQITDGYGAVRNSLAFGRAVWLSATNYSASILVSTIGCTWDSAPPECPSDVQKTSVSATTVSLGWNPVTDLETEVSHYEVRRDGAVVAKTSETAVTVGGLPAGGTTELRVVAVDAAQRVSTPCADVVVTTQPEPLTCTVPRPLAAPRALSASIVRYQTAVAATASEFGTAWIDSSNRLFFQRVSADGRPLANAVQVATANQFFAPGLVFTGSAYGLAWFNGGYFWLGILDATGAFLYPPTQLDSVLTPDTSNSYWQIGIASGGNRYCVVWYDSRDSGSTGRNVYASVASNTGALLYAGLAVSAAAGEQTQPAVVWSGTTGQFLIAWEDDSTTPGTIRTALLNGSTGIVSAPITVVTPPNGSSDRPALATDGAYVVLAYQDSRDPNGGGEIYTTLLTMAGARYGWADQRVTDDPAGSYNAALAYRLNGKFTIAWNDSRDGGARIWARESYYGDPSGLESRLHTTTELHVPRIALNLIGGLVTGANPFQTSQPNAAIPIGCVSDATPPTCAGGVAVTTVSAGQVSLAWSAATDSETGVSDYEVIRSGLTLGFTDELTWHDTGVAPGSTYIYRVVPRNWGGTSATCPEGIEVTVPATASGCGNPAAATAWNVVGGTSVNIEAPVIWHGAGFATVFVDSPTGELRFRKLWPDGSPAAPAVVVDSPVYNGYISGFVRDGAGYAVAWLSFTDYRYHFARLDADGAILVEVPVSVAQSTAPGYGRVALATSGSGFCVVFIDTALYGTNGFDITYTLLDGAGAVAGPAGAWHDLPLLAGTGSQLFPDVSFDGTALRYIVAFENFAVTPAAIQTAYILPATSVASTPASIPMSGASGVPSLVADGYDSGLIFINNRNGCFDLWFTRLDGAAARMFPEVQVNSTSCSPGIYEPKVFWTGTEFGIFWNDSAGDGNNAWYQRALAGGALAGSNVQATSNGDNHRVMAAYGSNGWVVTGSAYAGGSPGPLNAAVMGCTVDTTPPACAGNILAYNVSTGQATVSWSPSADPESGLAYYILYRNNAELVRTTSTTYTDTGLSSGNWNYMVQPVNSRGNQNVACTQSVWVKTGSSLTLMVTKSNLDALLAWDDGGLNDYTIFRGTSPQVLTLVGSTPELSAPHPNALIETPDFFYTVDDPGQE